MYQITEEEISQETIDKYIPQNLPLREKLIRKVNEMYQWHPETYSKATKGDYSFIEDLLKWHLSRNC